MSSREMRHDDLVAVLLGKLDGIYARAEHGPTDRDVETAAHKVEVEMRLGKGHVDLAITWAMLCLPTKDPALAADHMYQKPAWLRTGILIEVKSAREKWTAGGVIRQLKGYRETFGQQRSLTRGSDGRFWNDHCGHDETCTGIACQRRGPVLGFFCGRELSDGERRLLNCENILVLPYDWAHGEI